MLLQQRNIYLIGLMGAGKTTVGKMLAKHLGRDFYDSDHEIEKRTGVKIPIIFDLEGEDGFRKREKAAIHELSQMSNIVLATGGGAVLAPENREALKSTGVVIYLRGNVSELWHRTRHDKQRPLLQNVDVKAKLEQLYAERDPLYREIAAHIVDTGSQPVATIVNRIEQVLSES